jgi:predicted O-methyltransferase YrrM
MKICTPHESDLYQYALKIGVTEHPVLAKLRQATKNLPLANMQISPDQGQLLQFLLKMLNAKNVLELGTFTGYSTLCMALALPDDGKIVTCDRNPKWPNLAKTYWQDAGVINKITNHICPAKELMYEFINDGKTFDFIFIDADKTNYVLYYQLAKELVKNTGIIAIDNVLWHGNVIDTALHDRQTKEIRRLNEIIMLDEDIDKCLLNIADGLFLVKKRSFYAHPNHNTIK